MTHAQNFKVNMQGFPLLYGLFNVRYTAVKTSKLPKNNWAVTLQPLTSSFIKRHQRKRDNFCINFAGFFDSFLGTLSLFVIVCMVKFHFNSKVPIVKQDVFG